MVGIEKLPDAPIKWAFTTRRVRRSQVAGVCSDLDAAAPGDVILAEVVSIGQHSGVQLRTGRRASLYRGDLIAVCVAARYAPDQFECEARIDGDHADLAAAGGVAGVVVRKHRTMKTPTRLRVLGRLVNTDAEPVNIRGFALPNIEAPQSRPPVFAVLGSSMNAGKTVATGSLTRGFTRAGYRVVACKATGTGACGDFYTYLDAGARAVLDFTDLGHATTVNLDTNELESIYKNLIAHAVKRRANAVVIEIADGILQRETALLAQSAAFRDYTDGVVFAAGDALSAITGAERLEALGLQVSAVTGCLTRSPLAAEEADRNLNAKVLGRDELSAPEIAAALLAERNTPPVDLVAA